MALTEKDVIKLGRLSRLALSDADVKHYTKEISSILGWIEQLQAVNTEGVAELASVVDTKLPWRKDEVTEGGIQADVLANAPRADYGCYVVPKVIES